jgi:hypothetical protein
MIKPCFFMQNIATKPRPSLTMLLVNRLWYAVFLGPKLPRLGAGSKVWHPAWACSACRQGKDSKNITVEQLALIPK